MNEKTENANATQPQWVLAVESMETLEMAAQTLASEFPTAEASIAVSFNIKNGKVDKAWFQGHVKQRKAYIFPDRHGRVSEVLEDLLSQKKALPALADVADRKKLDEAFELLAGEGYTIVPPPAEAPNSPKDQKTNPPAPQVLA